jgi:hypothetical protein
VPVAWLANWGALPALLLCCGRLQVELQRVLYPLFIHVYLQLVQYGAFNMAADLLKQYRCEAAVQVQQYLRWVQCIQ